MNEFMTFIDNKRMDDDEERIRIFHWGHIEETLILNYDSSKWNNILQFVDFIDMCSIFQKEPIIISGMKNFGLKEVSKAMVKNGMIFEDRKDDEIETGLNAMFSAIQYYKNKTEEIMNKIIKYNYYDCKILFDIIEYLRKN